MWVEDLMTTALPDPAGRVVSVQCDEVEVDGATVGQVEIVYTVEDLRGDIYEARGRLMIPRNLSPGAGAAVVYHCGYEMSKDVATRQVVSHGRVSATVVQLPLDSVFPNAWSLLRGPKAEVVFGHLVRSLSFVDSTRIIYAGGSAGGYSALMAAAETFPCAAAVPGVPPTNLAYMSALTEWNHARLDDSEPTSRAWMEGMHAAAVAWKSAHGDDYDGPGWLGHSPVGHVDRITGPVIAFFSKTDVLVPISQVDTALAAAVETTQPGGVEFRAEVVSDAPAAHARLLDVLGDRALVQVLPVPHDALPMLNADLTMVTEMPPFRLPDVEPIAGRWHVLVADEGDPVFVVSHFKHQYEPDFSSVIDQALATPIGDDQLTAPKLDQLLARWNGEEWLAPGYFSLDLPEAERADVELGLRSYCTTTAKSERFRTLYEALPHERRVLPAALFADLCPTGAGARAPSDSARFRG